MFKAKNLLIVCLVASTILFASCQSKAGQYKDGAYNGTGNGKGGPIKVEVKVEGGKISDIKILEHNETPGLSDPIFEKIPKAIIKAQSTKVDEISGATITSQGIINAVSDALKSVE